MQSQIGALLVFLSISSGCEEPAESPANGRQAVPDQQVFSAPDDFPLPFSTQVSPGIGVETHPLSVEFTVAGEPDAFLRLTVLPENDSFDAGQEIVRAIAEAYGPIREFGEIDPAPEPSWAVESYVFEGRRGSLRELTGRVDLGERNGRWFHMHLQYPAGRTDLAARLRGIMEDWNWLRER